jgi:hypothetical protein
MTDDEIMKLVNSILGGCSGRDYYDYLCEQHWYGTRGDMLELVRAALASDQGAAVAVTEEDAMDTLVAVLEAIGYTEEFAESHPSLKVSEGVKLFLADKSAAVAVGEPQDNDYPRTETSQRVARFAMLQYLLRKIILVHEAGDKASTPLHEVIKNADNWLKENGLGGSKVRLAAAHPAIPGRFNAHRLKVAEECNERIMSACTEAGCPDGVNMADWIRDLAKRATPPAPIASDEDADVEVHVQLTKGGLEVSEPVVEFSKAFESRMDAEPGKVFKLYTHPAPIASASEPNGQPCVHADNPKACYRVRCQLGNKCVDDDMSFRAKGAPAAAAQPSKP